MAKKNDISQEAFEERMIKSLPGDSSLIGKLFYYHLNLDTPTGAQNKFPNYLLSY